MTVSTLINRNPYTGSGTQTIFPYEFKIFANTDLLVYVGGILQTVGYSVTGIGLGTGGNVVFEAGYIPASGVSVVLLRALPKTQEIDYIEGERFPADTHEGALDRLTMEVQDTFNDLTRAITEIPKGDKGDPGDPTISHHLTHEYDGADKISLTRLTGDPYLTGPYVDVRAFGPGGAGIQAAIDSIPAGYAPGGAILVPIGTYLCDVGLFNDDRRISLTGLGIDQTILKKNANDIDLLKLDICYQSIWQKIKDMTLDGNSKTGGKVLHLSQTNYIKLENLKICNSLSTDPALYLYQATGTILQDIYLWTNVKSAYFEQVHGCRIFNLKADLGTSADDIDFNNGAQTNIHGFNLSGGTGGVTIRDCSNFFLNGLYQESPLSVPAITIGTDTQGNYGVSLSGLNGTCSGAGSAGPFIRAKKCWGLAIRDMEVTQSQPAVHTGGWIELGDVYGVTIENILAWSMTAAYTSAINLIFSPGGGVGPTNVEIKNVYAYGVENTATIDLKATNLKIENTNVYINIKPNSGIVTLINCSNSITIQAGVTDIVLINCSGTIINASETETTRINSPG